jgi:hypothetical protein
VFYLPGVQSCYALAAVLLRGDRVSKAADNVSRPKRGRGALGAAATEPLSSQRSVRRDPVWDQRMLHYARDKGDHVTSCHNLAVMKTHGDDGVPPDAQLAEEYKEKTQEKVNLFGGF